MFHQLYRNIFKKSFFNRMLIIYAVTSIFSVLILTVVILHDFTKTMEDNALTLNQQILNRVGSYIDEKYNHALLIYQGLYHSNDSSMKAVSFFSSQNAGNALQAKAYVANQLNNDFAQDRDINDIVIEKDSDNSWYITESNQQVLREASRIPKDLDVGGNQPDGFVLAKAHDPIYRNNLLSTPMLVYTLSAPVMNASSLSSRVGMIYIEFNAKAVANAYSEYSQNLKGYLLVLTKNGGVIFDSSGKYYGGTYPYYGELMTGKTEMKLEKDSVVNVVHSSQAGVIVVGVIPKNEIYTVSNTIRQTVYLVSLACLLVTIALSYLTTKIVSRRAGAVTDAMKKLRSGDLSARIALKGEEDELGEIASNFNHMCDDLQNYIKRVYLAEIKQKNAQVNALQSQINPHFLYNTLESIRMMAITKDDEDAGDMIHLLASMFRSSLHDEMIIDIRSEIKYCGTYLDIFKIRFGDKLTSKIAVEEEVQAFGIPKHLLQPVVENYIVHGFNPNRNDNLVEITGRLQGDTIEFTISDNGKGILPARLRELEASLMKADSGNSIGLSNVNERIKLIYGEQFGLAISSEYGKGSVVTISIKAMAKEELRKNVQDING